ncbi:hypothetical protein VNO77_25015 [Canavalia gladiata]|uniref:Uncharacterized protein n=1 Tax=Canavalia gladiata TaxID=3824 RepID=A0AAN9QD56_CANGL
MVGDPSVDLVARGRQDCGEGGKTRSYSAMVDSSVDLKAGGGQGYAQGENTTLGTPRAMKAEMMDSSMDLTTTNPTLCTPIEVDTVMVNSNVHLIARSTLGCGQGENTIYTPRAMESKMVDSTVDFVVGNTTLNTPKEIETEMVDSSVDMIARHGQITPRTTRTKVEDSSVALIAAGGGHHKQGGNSTVYFPRPLETEEVDPSAELVAGNTKLCTAPRVMETELVGSSVDPIASCGQGEKAKLYFARVTETELEDSGVDLSVGNTRLHFQGVTGTGMVHPIEHLIAKTKQRRRQGGRGYRQGGRGGGPGGAGTTRWGTQGTCSRSSQRRVGRREQIKETRNDRSISIMEKVPSSLEGQAASMKRGSPSPEQLRSCKKTILTWLIDCKLIEECEEVCYMDAAKKNSTMTGRITRGGILCSCCKMLTSVWTFEKHAGSDLKEPYEHIYLPRKGKFLQDCQIAAWQDAREQKRRCMFSFVPKKTAVDPNDDTCPICGDGGALICCDKCPSTYHLSCMDMERVPENNWYCPYCVCKYCGKREKRKKLITCSQCSKKYHKGCFNEFSRDTLDLNFSMLYCGPGCREIYEKLEVSLGIRNDIRSSYSWRIIRQMDMTSEVVSATRSLQLENNSKVAVTWMLMNEAFETITDRHTGINIIQSIIYSRGSNLPRVGFSRFYMFVLEKDDEIIAAASMRFHGRGIAEMPFIATEEAHRGQGNCQALMRAIESFLCKLKVKRLVIPSALETSGMWKRKYGFTEVSKELMREISSYNILMFPCALRLYKDLSASIADSDGDNEDDQTDIQNDIL